MIGETQSEAVPFFSIIILFLKQGFAHIVQLYEELWNANGGLCIMYPYLLISKFRHFTAFFVQISNTSPIVLVSVLGAVYTECAMYLSTCKQILEAW